MARLDFQGLEGGVRRRDEIGDLNRDLRRMAAELQARWDDERALEQRRQDFVSAASHELKTPLALMRGYAEGLEHGIGEREKYLALMEEQIDRMDRLVLELLEQTRLERMEQLSRMEQVDLTGLIRTLLEQTAPLFDGLTVRIRLQEGCTISGDRVLLERAYGQSAVQRGPVLHPRRAGADPAGAVAPRPGVHHLESRRTHPGNRAPPAVRAILPGGQVQGPHRQRHGPGHRAEDLRTEPPHHRRGKRGGWGAVHRAVGAPELKQPAKETGRRTFECGGQSMLVKKVLLQGAPPPAGGGIRSHLSRG